MKNNFSQIGDKIRISRKSKGLTQEEFSEKINISQVEYGRIERGEVTCTLKNLAKIAKALNVSIDYLLFDENSVEDDNIIHQLIKDLDPNASYHLEEIIVNFLELNK